TAVVTVGETRRLKADALSSQLSALSSQLSALSSQLSAVSFSPWLPRLRARRRRAPWRDHRERDRLPPGGASARDRPPHSRSVARRRTLRTGPAGPAPANSRRLRAAR